MPLYISTCDRQVLLMFVHLMPIVSFMKVINARIPIWHIASSLTVLYMNVALMRLLSTQL